MKNGIPNQQFWEALAEPAHYNSKRLAKLAGFCPRHARRLIRKVFGCSPSVWLKKRRLEHAKMLLLSNKHQIKWVAFTLHYTHDNNFSREFKTHCGVTPIQFVQQGLRSRRNGASVAPRLSLKNEQRF